MKGGGVMDNMLTNGIPNEAVAKRRTFNEVMDEYQRALEGEQEAIKSSGEIQESVLLRATMAAAYRMYLLGVEDGMKEVSK